ncbi:MAG TPA: IscA/HesB family protein [Smithellaceae bacterium]|jgi:iron-sulfur cluster assembly protein|nr:IscA/HesB family protein [Smithellaceae bacterium]
MLNVTDKASEVIADFMKNQKEGAAIRVLLNMACSGPSLSMALDDANTELDEVISAAGATFVIEKELLDQVKPITIDFITTPQGAGFKLTSSLPEGGGCGSCSCH